TEIRTDSVIRYDQRSGRMATWGNITSVPAGGDEVRSRYLACDLDDAECQAARARTKYSEGADWYVTSDLPLIRTDLQYGHHALFTSCELEEPHYHFETDELKIVRGSILVAKPVRLYFADVPVAWLPFIAQSLSQGRASGLLTPRFSVNDIVRTSGGYRRRVSNVGFYWAMNDYMDATMALDWFDENYTAITGSYRYRWLRQFLQGGLNFRRFWRAQGGTELTLDTDAAWDFTERTSFRASARYASSSEFVVGNSFNPQEVTQSIDSEGGMSHRFDWGNLSVNGNRRQFLSDDRVETTFPSASLSLKTITLFPAPRNRAGFFNNMTWSGSARFSASTTDLAQGPVFVPGQEDRSNVSASLSTGLSLGSLSLNGSSSYRKGTTKGVRDTLPTLSLAQMAAEGGILALSTPEAARALAFQTGDPLFGDPFDVAEEDLTWNASMNYQQRLVGSTTLTPRVTFSGAYRRSDRIPEASSSFVAGPVRTAVGATLKSDVYGFFPGFAGFERIRHKLSPSFTWEWSPEVTPNERQAVVFGARTLQPRNVLTLTLNQTFEARRGSEDDAQSPDSTADAASPVESGLSTEPRRVPRSEIVNLLGIRTSAVRYDFVEADSANSFLLGFQTVQLTNQLTSDLLRGLTVSMTHDLFQDTFAEDAAPGARPDREFKPKLTQMNLGFSLSSRSSIFRWLGFGPDRPADDEEDEEDLEEDLLEDDTHLACRSCHAPHESNEPGLFVADRSMLCIQCH
ncbi:MAG: putative LPS assembly protein LptD, partial [Longimicrobiales bacterium]|nr:putative LPS assembly protein LptD [Longimicrobiales bacterium]